MNKRKILSLVLTATLFLSTGVIGVQAQNLSDVSVGVSNISSTQCNSIELDGIETKLYLEFSDREEALNSFESKYIKELTFIKKQLGLDDISLENWQDYYISITGIKDTLDNIPDYVENSLIKMEQFFDIFENTDKNEEIMSLYNNLIAKNKNFSYVQEADDKKQLINMLLPYTSNKNINKSISSYATTGIDESAAINYASKYATSPNEGPYLKLSSDCTNFVSQILEAGGVQQEVYSSEFQGWWHKLEEGKWIDKHTHSVSWINANTFANYMGVYYMTTSHYNFSKEVDTADIIAYDKSRDGDWDHMAFVTDKGSYKTVNGKSFYDYKVAQHTKYYHKWTSDSGNGWEDLEDDGYNYGIIRR